VSDDDNACEPSEQLILLYDGNDESDLIGWSLLLLVATVWSFAHLPFRLSDHNYIITMQGEILIDCA